MVLCSFKVVDTDLSIIPHMFTLSEAVCSRCPVSFHFKHQYTEKDGPAACLQCTSVQTMWFSDVHACVWVTLWHREQQGFAKSQACWCPVFFFISAQMCSSASQPGATPQIIKSVSWSAKSIGGPDFVVIIWSKELHCCSKELTPLQWAQVRWMRDDLEKLARGLLLLPSRRDFKLILGKVPNQELGSSLLSWFIHCLARCY